MGLSGAVLSRFTSFLQNLQQRVKIGTNLSKVADIDRGVPQEFIISPMLFNLYMEPLTEILTQSKVSYHMYADDTQLYIKLSSQENICRQDDILRKTQCWLAHNHLKLNLLKTEFILFAPYLRSQQPQPYFLNVKLLNCTPTIWDSIKSLGITLDSNLNM